MNEVNKKNIMNIQAQTSLWLSQIKNKCVWGNESENFR